MTKLMTAIATEEVDVFEYDENEVDKLFNGLDVGLESVTSLVKINDLIKNGELTQTSVKLTNIALNNFSKSLKVELPAISLESTDSPKIALENAVTDFIKKIWEYIKNTFKRLWAYLTSSTEEAKYRKINKKQEEVKNKIKSLNRSKQNEVSNDVMEKNVKRLNEILQSQLVKFPTKLNVIDFNYLFSFTKNILSNTEAIEKIVSYNLPNVKVLTKTLHSADVYTYDAQVRDKLDNTVKDIVKNCQRVFKDIDTKLVMSNFNGDPKDIDISTIRGLTGYLNNGFAWTGSSTDLLTHFYLHVQPSSDINNNTVSITSLTTDEIYSIVTVIDEISEVLLKLNKSDSNHKVIWKDVDYITDNMGKVFNSNTITSDVSKNFTMFKDNLEVVKYIVKQQHNLVKLSSINLATISSIMSTILNVLYKDNNK